MPHISTYPNGPTRFANFAQPTQQDSAGPIGQYLLKNAHLQGAAEAARALHRSFGKSYELDLSASTPDAVERIPLEQLLAEQPSARPAHVTFPEKMDSRSINRWIRLLPDLVSMTAPKPVTSARQPIDLQRWKGQGSFLTDTPIHSIGNPLVGVLAMSRKPRPPEPSHQRRPDAVVTDRTRVQGPSRDNRLAELRNNPLPSWKDHVRVFEKASTKDPLLAGIWPSSSHPGFSVRVPGEALQRAPNLKAANALLQPYLNEASWKSFSDSVAGIWGADLAAIRKEPTEAVTRPVIWPSPDGHGFGLHIPEAGTFHASDLPQVEDYFKNHPEFRVLNTVQQKALQAQEKLRAEVRLLWGDKVSTENRQSGKLPADSATIRPSSQGGFRVSAAGHQKRVDSLQDAVPFFRRCGIRTKTGQQRDEQDAARQNFSKQVGLVLGRGVKAVDTRPPVGDRQASVWPSASEPGKYGVRLPNGKDLRVSHLHEAGAELKAYGIPLPHRISNGQHITVTGTDLPPDELARLEKLHGIDITPLRLDGKTVGYCFSPGGLTSDQTGMAMVISHGGKGAYITSPDKTFVKKEGLEFVFGAPRNHLLVSRRFGYATELRNGQRPVLKDNSQIYSSLSEMHAVNYKLDSAHEHESPERTAKFVGEMKSQKYPRQFPIVLLNSCAEGVHLADLLQALQDTRGMPPQVICKFCRAEPGDKNRFATDKHFSPR